VCRILVRCLFLHSSSRPEWVVVGDVSVVGQRGRLCDGTFTCVCVCNVCVCVGGRGVLSLFFTFCFMVFSFFLSSPPSSLLHGASLSPHSSFLVTMKAASILAILALAGSAVVSSGL